MRYRTAVGLAFALGLVGAAAVRQRAAAIRGGHDPYPYGQLSQELDQLAVARNHSNSESKRPHARQLRRVLRPAHTPTITPIPDTCGAASPAGLHRI